MSVNKCHSNCDRLLCLRQCLVKKNYSCRDLGATITHDSSPSLHTKTHQRANSILRCFLSGDVCKHVSKCSFCIRAAPCCWVLYCCVVTKSKARYWHNYLQTRLCVLKTIHVVIEYSILDYPAVYCITATTSFDLIFCYNIASLIEWIVFGTVNVSFSSFSKFSLVKAATH